MLWSQPKNDSGPAWVDAADDSSELSMEDIWKVEGKQGSDMRIDPIETAVDD